MKLPAAALSLLVLLLPTAQAGATLQALAAPAASAASGCAGPPCGYITPIVDLEFADKPKCSGSPGSIDLAKCIPVPAKGQSVSFTGTFRYYWKLSEDLTYPPGQEPVVVSFSGVSTNPKWLTFKIEPATITIDAVALVSPQNMRVDRSNPSSPVIYYDFQAPVTVTFTHSGDPDAAALEKIVAKGGIADVYVKAKSSASGAYFKEGFGVESFRFNAAPLLPQQDASNRAPGGFLAPLLGLCIAALARRRA
ncbi:MAG: hypothetical protein LC623_02315 [Halobacteriales archaeon]|nr:hypothetical protein [Halobacteriales archaeon]